MHTTSHRSEIVGQLVLVDVDPTRRRVNRAIAGFLAGYTGTTLEAYIEVSWSMAKRARISGFGCEIWSRRSRSTATRPSSSRCRARR